MVAVVEAEAEDAAVGVEAVTMVVDTVVGAEAVEVTVEEEEEEEDATGGELRWILTIRLILYNLCRSGSAIDQP